METIAALASGGGTAAVALIRVSGPESERVVDCLSGGAASRAQERRATLVKLRDGRGRVLDEVLVTVFRGRRSFTGETSVEIACHGGRWMVRRILAELMDAGARAAGPGEFTQRAFLNGKLDLTQAEAVMDLISAQSDLALRAAHEQLEGRLGRQTEGMRADLLGVVAHLEAWIDFPEEDIDPDSGAALVERVVALRQKVEGLLSTSEQGRMIREGVRTVLCGKPNAGKSSLLNCLLGVDRAIVSGEAGTTRDTIEETYVIGGLPLRLVDTAGLRGEGGEVEQEGIRRSRKEAERADLLLVVVDASLAPGEAMPQLPEAAGARRLWVLNKVDLGEDPGWEAVEGAKVRVSCVDGKGMAELEKVLAELLEVWEVDAGEHLVAINARHRECLSRAELALERAEALLVSGAAAEFAAMELREAMEALGEIAGRVDTEEVLGEIFGRFCIGK